jgi:hypothetical protein
MGFFLQQQHSTKTNFAVPHKMSCNMETFLLKGGSENESHLLIWTKGLYICFNNNVFSFQYITA